MLWNPAYLGVAGSRPVVDNALPTITPSVWALDFNATTQLSQTYTDFAGTTPVTASGQFVAHTKNLLGGAAFFGMSFADSRPTIQYNALGTRPALRFSGAVDADTVCTLTVNGVTDPGTLFQGRDFTLAVVYRRSALGTTAALFSAGNSTGGTGGSGFDVLQLETGADGSAKIIRNTGSQTSSAFVTASGVTAGQLCKVVCRGSQANGLGIRMRTSGGNWVGTAPIPTSPDVTVWNRVILGGGMGLNNTTTPRNPLVGDIFEFRFWGARATDAQADQLQGYLDLAWGN